MKMRLVFKGGAVVDADVTEFETGRSPLTGELTRLKWTTPENPQVKLFLAELDQIAAIFAVYDEPGSADTSGTAEAEQ